MNRYWDVPALERARLTADQVEAMVQVHLMEKGIVTPEPPTLMPVPEKPDPGERRQVFQLGNSWAGLIFDNLHDAEAVAAMPTSTTDYFGDCGTEYKFAVPCQAEIKPITVYDRDRIIAIRAHMAKAKEIEETNKEMSSAYDKAIRECGAEAAEVWEDWSLRRKIGGELDQVVRTWERFLGLSDGNEQVAAKFLISHIEREASLRNLKDGPTDHTPLEIARMALEFAGKPIPDALSGMPESAPEPFAAAVSDF